MIHYAKLGKFSLENVAQASTNLTSTNMGYKHPTPIQTETIPLALQGRDIIGLAETGSGKTAAFTLPLLSFLMEKPDPFFGLILAPTRELADQISRACQSLGSTINVRTVTLVGGMDMVPQSIAIGKKPHIIVATPGRLLDHLENTKGFSLRNLKFLIMGLSPPEYTRDCHIHIHLSLAVHVQLANSKQTKPIDY